MTTNENTEDALLEVIRSESESDKSRDDARTVYSDWLEENGQTLRAEYIRLLLRVKALGEDNPRRGELLRRAARMHVGAEWRASLEPKQAITATQTEPPAEDPAALAALPPAPSIAPKPEPEAPEAPEAPISASMFKQSIVSNLLNLGEKTPPYLRECPKCYAKNYSDVRKCLTCGANQSVLAFMSGVKFLLTLIVILICGIIYVVISWQQIKDGTFELHR